MRLCRYILSILLIISFLCSFLPAGAKGTESIVFSKDPAEEIVEAELAEETAEEEESEEEDEVLWLGRIKLAKSATIALRATMTTGKNFIATGTALNGEIVPVLEVEQQWAYVRSRDGEGYILLKFLTEVPPGTEEDTTVVEPTPEPSKAKGPYLPASDEPFIPTSYLKTRDAFPREAGEAEKVLLTFIGDVTLGGNEADHKNNRAIDAYVKEYGYQYPFSKVRYILEQDDLTIANFEGTFHSDSTGLTAQTKKAYNFRATPDYVEILKQGSVEAVALGNNHTADYGEPGFSETIDVLDQNGIAWFGNTDYSAKSWVYEHNGVRIGFVSCYISYWVINNGEHIPAISTNIESVKGQGVDVLIAYVHGGVEYEPKHDTHQERLARYFISKGADIVIGGHPHCLQGCQLLDGVPVFYSLGNFVFGGNFSFYHKRHHSFLRYTAILQCALSFDQNHKYLGCRCNIVPCRLGEDTAINQYQPFPVTGEEAEACIKDMQVDTNKNWRLENLQEGVGAMQVFIPAKGK